MSLILHECDIFPFMPALPSLLSSYLVSMRVLVLIRFTCWADVRQFFENKRQEFSKAHTRAPFCVVYCLTSSQSCTMKGLYHGVPTHRCVCHDAIGVFWFACRTFYTVTAPDRRLWTKPFSCFFIASLIISAPARSVHLLCSQPDPCQCDPGVTVCRECSATCQLQVILVTEGWVQESCKLMTMSRRAWVIFTGKIHK